MSKSGGSLTEYFEYLGGLTRKAKRKGIESVYDRETGQPIDPGGTEQEQMEAIRSGTVPNELSRFTNSTEPLTGRLGTAQSHDSVLLSKILGGANPYPGLDSPRLATEINGQVKEIEDKKEIDQSDRVPTITDTETDGYIEALRGILDPNYAARASEDVMGQYAAMTGGMPSTAAVAASQQAGDLYAAKMADVLPQLYQQAYAMYQDQGNAMRDNLNMLRGLDADAYGRYQDDVDRFNANRNFDYNALRGQISDAQAAEELAYRRYLGELDQFNANRNFNYDALRSQISDAQYGEERAYNQYLNELAQYNADRDFNYGRVRDQIADAYNADTTQYQRYLDELENARYEDETAYKRALDALDTQTTLAQLGGQIGDYSGYEALGFTPDAEAMLRMQLAGAGRTAPVGSGSSGGSSRSSSSKSSSEKPTLTVAQVEKAIKEGRVTQKVLDAYEYYYGEPYQSEYRDALLATERADELDKMNTPSASRLEGNYTIPNAIMENLIAARRSGVSDEELKALLDRNQSRGDLTKSQHDALLVYFDLD